MAWDITSSGLIAMITGLGMYTYYTIYSEFSPVTCALVGLFTSGIVGYLLRGKS